MSNSLDRKINGVHYTPPKLAGFLAQQIWVVESQRTDKPIRILDPACGEGQLLRSMVETIGDKIPLEIVGFETDARAAGTARANLDSIANSNICCQDFLEYVCDDDREEFDIVISNPPYVRTQNLGAVKVKQLRERFELTGRIDLYQAFCTAMTRKLKFSGTLGLLTSNRFMYVQSGRTMRRMLLDNYRLRKIFDLGDSKPFSASVLPVVLIATREATVVDSQCDFVRIYQSEKLAADEATSVDLSQNDLFKSIVNNTGRVVLNGINYSIEKGRFREVGPGLTWTLSNEETDHFLSRIAINRHCVFADLAEIKVGIKTTADSVFIGDDWERMSTDMPEATLLQPLITHHVCRRWKSVAPIRKVLYPYRKQAKREPIDLDRYPAAKHYLMSHYDRLNGRKYLQAAGRKWYEVWVPQQPNDWKNPKIVWPDISERPSFSWDDSGAIVNGDCYWIKLNPATNPDWLYLMLAVANSTLVTRFYDCQFHNKLYAGRRRFMTQYVKQFPLPDIDRPMGKAIVDNVQRLLRLDGEDRKLESEIDSLVFKALHGE